MPGLIGNFRLLNRTLDETLGRLGAVDSISRDLESRKPLGGGEFTVQILGPDGRPAGPSAITQASSLSPSPGAPGGAPGGGGAGLPPPPLPGTPIDPLTQSWRFDEPKTVSEILNQPKQGVRSGREGGGGGFGVRSGLPNAVEPEFDPEAIAAAVMDVVPIDAKQFRGAYSGKSGQAQLLIILIAVSENGKNVPSDYLRIAAAWYVYVYLPQQSSKAGSASAGGGQSGTGRDRGGFGDFNWAGNGLPGRANRGVGIQQSTGPQGGADIGFSYSKSIASGVNQTATATQQLVGAVNELTSVVKRGQNSVHSRPGGLA